MNRRIAILLSLALLAPVLAATAQQHCHDPAQH